MSHIRIHIPTITETETVSIADRETLHKVNDVLRLKRSAIVHAFDGKGSEFSCEVIESMKTALILRRQRLLRRQERTSRPITLAFPLLREDKIDLILQKATELGVDIFSPFISSRTIQEIPSAAKIARWHKIILEATRQSERLWFPELTDTSRIEAVARSEHTCKIVASQNAKTHLLHPDLNAHASILLISGPEGDFSPEEEMLLKNSGFTPVNLSRNILRAETASIIAVGLVSYYTSCVATDVADRPENRAP